MKKKKPLSFQLFVKNIERRLGQKTKGEGRREFAQEVKNLLCREGNIKKAGY